MVLGALLLALGCGGDSGTGPDLREIEITPRTTLLVGIGDTTTLQATVVGPDGEPRGGSVAWTSQDPGVVEVTTSGLATAVADGVATLVASHDGLEAVASVEVYLPPEVEQYVPGESYFGRNEYVAYIPGELPVVLSAPHGGLMEPDEIPNRTYGTTVTDRNTREVILAARQAFIDRTGKAPHVIISQLRRTKLDPNREIVEAAQGNPFAERAWEEFQGFIEQASDEVAADYGAGLYFDIHGHGHAIPRVEIGVLLSGTQLGFEASLLNGLGHISSLAALASRVDLEFTDLVRGPTSFGALLQDRGFRSVPSPGDPHPDGNAYFSGGYNTARHGSRQGGTIDGMQLELHFPGVRDDASNRAAFASALAEAVELYMLEHYGFYPVSPVARRASGKPVAPAPGLSTAPPALAVPALAVAPGASVP